MVEHAAVSTLCLSYLHMHRGAHNALRILVWSVVRLYHDLGHTQPVHNATAPQHLLPKRYDARIHIAGALALPEARYPRILTPRERHCECNGIRSIIGLLAPCVTRLMHLMVRIAR